MNGIVDLTAEEVKLNESDRGHHQLTLQKICFDLTLQKILSSKMLREAVVALKLSNRLTRVCSKNFDPRLSNEVHEKCKKFSKMSSYFLGKYLAFTLESI